MTTPLPQVAGGFHIITKPIGPVCNLDCKYCFYLEKENLYPEERAAGKRDGLASWGMKPAVLERYIRAHIEAHPGPEIHFAWQGGEPTLLGVGFFERVVAWQAHYANGATIHNAFQTNGTLLDDTWCAFLKANRFLVGLSIDGPEALHDAYRVDKGDKPTFKRVMRGLECLKKHDVEFNTLTCVQRNNSKRPLEVYRFLREAGSGYLQFIPIVERIAATPGADGLTLVQPGAEASAQVAPWSVRPLEYGKFMHAIFEEWVRNDVGRVFVQLFDVSLGLWAGYGSSLCIFRETCGDALALEHNGDLYACDHFVYPSHKLGNIMDGPLPGLVASPFQRQFGEAKRDTLPKYCRECRVRFACNGECPKHRFLKTPDGEEGLNYLCEGYKYFFTKIDPYMRFMASELRQQRPPANVMAWARQQDLAPQPPGAQPKQNGPCPCGSGKKYKRCCGR